MEDGSYKYCHMNFLLIFYFSLHVFPYIFKKNKKNTTHDLLGTVILILPTAGIKKVRRGELSRYTYTINKNIIHSFFFFSYLVRPCSE